MGSFDFTCAVSGLPIGAGTPVRFCLLESSPYSSSGDHANGELSWYLRSLPIRAKYDDYGSIESIDPEDTPICQNWLEGLQVDMVEKGWGDNTCHDTPTRRDMTFDELLAALSEDRLEVRSELKSEAEEVAHNARLRKLLGQRKKKVSRGIPTIRRVEAAIQQTEPFTYTVDADHVVRGPGGRYVYEPKKNEKNYATYDPHAGFGCGERVEGTSADTWRLDAALIGNAEHKLIVDELQCGEIRVRCGGYTSGMEEAMRLAHLAKKLRRRYSVMLSPGEFGHAQLLVHPKPGTKDGEHLFAFYRKDTRPQTLHVAAAMVREDVWQVLCGMSTETWDKDYNTVKRKLDAYRTYAEGALIAYPKPDTTKDALDTRCTEYLWKDNMRRAQNPVGWFIAENPSISGFGMDTSWTIFVNGERTPEEIKTFLDVLAQTALVRNVLGTIRHSWRPVGSSGPQCGEWREHATFLQAVALIAAKKAEEREQD